MKRYSLELNGKHIKDAQRLETLLPLINRYANGVNLVTLWDMKTGKYKEY